MLFVVLQLMVFWNRFRILKGTDYFHQFIPEKLKLNLIFLSIKKIRISQYKLTYTN